MEAWTVTKDIKDISDIARKYGPEAVRSAVENPKPFLEDNDEFAAALAKSGAENKIIAIPGGQASVVDNAPEKTLVEQFGCPAFFNFKGALSKLNEPFWAAYYARQELELLFEPNEQEFYSYDETTGLFVVRSPDLIRKKLAAQILEAGRLWDGLSALERFRNDTHLHGVLKHLRGEVEMPEAFKAAGRIVHLSNCVLVFNEDGSFENKPFSPSFRSRNRSPIAYDPNAECPQFKTKILGHIEEDDRDLLQQYGGQCLLGRNHTQRILILDGIGSASKSTFVLLTRGVIGAANTYELRTKHLAERFEIGRMIGKTMLLGADVKANFLSEEGAYRLKALVGGDTLEAEPKTSNKRFSISGIFNVMLTCNSRLRVHLEGDESAWRRRLAIVRCEQPFNLPKIPDIDQILLRREGSGILNWFLEGTQKLLRSIQQTGDIALSTRQLERVHALLSESDSLRIYLRENLA
jgi:hypothetical protein